MTFDIDPTIPCLQKYDITDTNNLKDCCFQTCAAFLGPQNVQNIVTSDCGIKCRQLINQSVVANGKHNLLVHELPAPFLQLQSGNFKNCCMQNNGDVNKALECCLNLATSSREQQICLDAYNSLINVRESYIGGPTNRCLVFLIMVLLGFNGCTYYMSKSITKDLTQEMVVGNIIIGSVYYFILNYL